MRNSLYKKSECHFFLQNKSGLAILNSYLSLFHLDSIILALLKTKALFFNTTNWLHSYTCNVYRERERERERDRETERQRRVLILCNLSPQILITIKLYMYNLMRSANLTFYHFFCTRINSLPTCEGRLVWTFYL